MIMSDVKDHRIVGKWLIPLMFGQSTGDGSQQMQSDGRDNGAARIGFLLILVESGDGLLH